MLEILFYFKNEISHFHFRVSYVVKAKEYEVLSSNETEVDLDLLVAAERERIKAEFYATYDVMTGVRIAATLGCMFALMVFLIVYKSRSETSSVLDVSKLKIL